MDLPDRTPVVSPNNLPTRTPVVPNAKSMDQKPDLLASILSGKVDSLSSKELSEYIQRVSADGDRAWVDITAEMARRSCAYTAYEMLSGAPEAPYNGRFFVAEHHEEWDQLIQKYDRICVLAPRDHGKTWFFDFAYPIWQAMNNPDGVGYIFSATKEQAIRILGDIKNEIESNPKLTDLMPKRRDVGAWSSTHIKLSNGHHIYARGYATRVRGAHPNWIVVDDALNDETAYSATVRQKQKDYFFNAITNMIVPGGQIIVVGTPYHVNDLYGELKKNPAYAFRQYQALKSDGTALWPDRYDKARLEARMREIGTIRFTREFQTNPIADDMSLFPLPLFRGEPVEQFQVKLGMPLEYWEQMGIQGVYIGGDFAISSNVQADYTVFFVAGKDKFGNRWVMDIVRGHGLPYQEQLSLLNATARRYNAALIFLEANQMQRIFGDELIRTTDLPIKKYTTGVEKHSLEKGIPSMRVLLENKKFRIPRGDQKSIELTDAWIDELHNFTFQDGAVTSVGEHDDLAMASWICEQAIQQGGFSFAFGDDAAVSKEAIAAIESVTGKQPGNGDSVNSSPSEQGTVNLVDPYISIYPNLFGSM